MWKRQPTVRIGNEKVEVKPLTIEKGVRFCLLFLPYLPAHWPRIRATLEGPTRRRFNLFSRRPKLLALLLKDLRQEMGLSPAEVATAFSLLLNRPVEWIVQNAGAEDLLDAIPALDKANDFRGMFQSVTELLERWGMTANG